MSLYPTYYLSTDPSAPVLSGTAGSLAALLDALLVDGYGSGGTAKPGLGWTREFTASNKRSFRTNAVTGSGYRVRVDDTATIGNARHAFVRGYETMSDVDTGSGPLPTTALLTNGGLIAKSNALDSSARAWVAIGNERCFYLFINVRSDTTVSTVTPHFFGDFFSFKPGDLHNFAMTFNGLTTYTGAAVDADAFKTVAYSNTTLNNMVLARAYTGTGGSIQSRLVAAPMAIDFIGGQSQPAAYPFPVNNGLLYCQVPLTEAQSRPRGFMPGIYAPMHNRPFTTLVEQSDIGGMPPGTKFLPVDFSVYYGDSGLASRTGQALFDITNEWV